MENKYQKALYLLHNNLREDGMCMPLAWQIQIYKAEGILQELVDKATPKKSVMKNMQGFDKEVASQLVCPCCKQPIVNVWSVAKYQPNYCHFCGQALEWED